MVYTATCIITALYFIGPSKCREGSWSSLETHCFYKGEEKGWTWIRTGRCCASHAKESNSLMETNITISYNFCTLAFTWKSLSYTQLLTDSNDVLFHVYSCLALFPSLSLSKDYALHDVLEQRSVMTKTDHTASNQRSSHCLGLQLVPSIPNFWIIYFK